jgi:tetratricopeptide (TPR) repeat protein
MACWIRLTEGNALRAFVALSLFSVSIVRAAPLSENEVSARSAFKEAQRAYDAGDFQAALKRFGDAYALMPHPDFLFNMAQCHRQLGDYERAGFLYRRFISMVEDPKRVELAKSLLAEAEKKGEDSKRKGEEQEALRRQHELEIAKLSAQQPVAAPAPAVMVESTPAPAPEQERSVLSRWWLWAGIGAVVAAGAVTYAVASNQPPAPSLGEIRF